MHTHSKQPNAPKAHTSVLLARILFLFFAAGVFAFILFNSSRVGAASSQLSTNVTNWINDKTIVAYTGVSFSETLVRKLGHIGEFALLGLALFICLRTFTPRPLQKLGWILFAGLAAGVTDELLQLFVPGRSSEVLDVLIDFSGLVLGICLGILLVRLARPLFRKLDK